MNTPTPDSNDSEDPLKNLTPEQLTEQIKDLQQATATLPELKERFQKIDELTKKRRITPIPSEGVIILIATIAAYIITFIFKYACLSPYALPFDFTRVDADDLIIAGVLTLTILTFPLILMTLDTFIASVLSKNNLTIYHKSRESLGTLILLILLMLISLLNMGWKPTLLATAVTLLLLSFVKNNLNKTTKLKEPKTPTDIIENTNTLSQGSADMLKRWEIIATYNPLANTNILNTILFITIGTGILASAGRIYHQNKTTYAFIETNPLKLLITRNTTSAIFADYDTNKMEIQKRWTIIDLNNLPSPLAITNFKAPPRLPTSIQHQQKE
jgi:hypothetical protein